MKRKPLHYGVHLVVGLFILIFSLITMATSDNANVMQLFAFIGGIFVIIGIIKFFIQRTKEAKPSLREEKFAEKMAGINKINRQEEHIMEEVKQDLHLKRQVPTVIYCAHCHAKNYNTSNFCHICGMRLP